ncbi:phage major capsid protein [Atopobiaceae bacterium 24-176]
MPIALNDASTAASKRLMEAFAGSDPDAVEAALVAFQQSVADDLAVQYKEAVAAGDRAVLAQRGFRELTSTETKFYQRLIEAGKSPNPQQAFTSLTGDPAVPDEMLPTTVIDQVLKDLEEEHPLLGAINMTNTGMVVRWLRNKHTRQLASWGTLESVITKEITSAFEVVDIKQGKLSCFAVISIDMLELGPTFLDAYLRRCLMEAMACGLEDGVINGKGIGGEPVGLMKKVSGTVNTTTGYPAKTAESVTEFTPATYGALVGKLVKDSDGRTKTGNVLKSLSLIVNTEDYLTKVMPATTLLNTAGSYVNDLFPLATKVYESAFVPAGKAVLCLLDEYDLFVGGNRGIQYSDEFKFLDDQRVFKVVQYAFGQAKDESSAIVLDISKLDSAYITVKAKTDAAAGSGD